MSGADHDWQIIIALGAALNAMTLGIIKYLLKKLDQCTSASEKVNEQNAVLASLYVKGQEEKADRK